MFSLTHVTDLVPDRPVRESESRLQAGRARRLLRDLVWFESSPTRVVRLGVEGLHLPTELPGTMVRAGTLANAATWRGWPDVVWCDHLLSSPGAEIPVGTTLDRLADAVPRGGLLALVDLHGDTPADLASALGLRPARNTLSGLRDRFTGLHEATVAQANGSRSLLFLGRR
jgi:hypothetical protein